MCSHHLYSVLEHSPHSQTPKLLNMNSSLPSPPALGNHRPAFCLYGFASSGDFIQMEPGVMWPLCDWLLSLDVRCRDPSASWHVVHSFCAEWPSAVGTRMSGGSQRACWGPRCTCGRAGVHPTPEHRAHGCVGKRRGKNVEPSTVGPDHPTLVNTAKEQETLPWTEMHNEIASL